MSSTDDLLADLEDGDGASGSKRGRGERSADRGGRTGLRGRLGDRVGHLFSLRGFLLALGLSAAGLFVSGFVPLLPETVAALLGVFAGTFALGLVGSRRRYAESAAAGGAVVAVATLLNFLVLSLISGVGPSAVGVASGGAGVLAGLLGHYFGRDLRAGVTRDLN